MPDKATSYLSLIDSTLHDEGNAAEGAPAHEEAPPTAPAAARALSPAPAQPAAAPPPAAPAYGDLIDQELEKNRQEDQRDVDFTAWRTTQDSLTPEKALEVRALASATGKPVPYVAENLDEVRKQADQEKIRQALLDSPTLREYMADPSKAAFVKDSIADASTWEWLFGRWGLTASQEWDPIAGGYRRNLALVEAPAWAKAARQGWAETVTIPALANKQLLGQASEKDLAELERLERDVAGRDLGAHNPLTRGIVGATKMAPYIVGSMLARIAGGAAGGAIAGGATAEAGPGAIAGAGAGVAVGQYVGGAAFDFLEQVGPMYRNLRQLKRADGEPLLSDNEARAYATTSALALAGITSGIASKAIKSVPMVKDVLERATQQSVERALVEETAARTAVRTLGRYGEHVAAGGALMAAQNAGNAATLELAKGTHGEEASLAPVFDAAKHGFVAGIQDMSLIAGWEPGRSYLYERGLAAASATEAARLNAIAEHAKESELLTRSPKESEELFGKMALAQGAPRVLADPVAWDSYWTGKKVDPRKVAADLSDDSGAMYDHVKAGLLPDLAFQLEKWTARLGKTEHLAGLRQDVKLSGEARTPRQQVEWGKQQEKLAQQLGGIEGNADGRTAQLDAIEHGKYLELLHSGRSDLEAQSVARLHRDALDHFSRTERLEPVEILRRYPLRFIGKDQAPKALELQPTAEEPARAAAPDAEQAKLPLAPGTVNGPAEGHVVTPEAAPVEPPKREVPPVKPLDMPDELQETVLRAYRGDRAAIDELHRRAHEGYRDTLTPLGNARAHQEFIETPAAKGGVHVVMDMPGLKARNDKHGQLEGDRALKVFGTQLAEASRAQRGKAHRMTGGDEFYAHFESQEQATAFVNEFQRRLASPAGTLRQGDQLSAYAGVGASKEEAAARLVKAKGAAKAKYGDSRKGGAVGHGESFVVTHDGPLEAPAPKSTEARQIGSSLRVVTPQRPGGEPAHYEAIEAEHLIPSHTPDSFQPDARYPAGVQEREYHRSQEEQVKVVQGGQRLNPALVLSDTPSAVDGPPLVTAGEKALVVGGNGRSMMLLRAMREEGTRDAYRKALLEKAQAFGLDRAKLDAMKAPILVRVLDQVHDTGPKEELVAAVRRTNEGLTQALSPKARAVAEAKNMTDATVHAIGQVLDGAGDASLRDVMRDQPAKLVEILRRDGIINQQNQAQWLQGGALTDEAKDRVEGMFLGRVIGSGDRMASTTPAMLAKIERLAPALLRVAGVNPAMDEIPVLQAAVDLVNDARRRDMNLEQLFGQGSLFGGSDVLPHVAAMARLLDAARPKELAKRFNEWADQAAFDPRQATMFAPPPSADQARAVLFADESGTATLFQTGKGDERRGEIRFQVDPHGDVAAFDVRLLAADESTAAHELGHWMGLVLGQLASRPEASEENRQLYRTALDAMGYADHGERVQALLEAQDLRGKKELAPEQQARLTAIDAKEEKLSHAFELYLAEGKAPTTALARTFARFKLWMVRIYRGLQGIKDTYRAAYGQDLELSDDVRRMFDRVLGADDAAARAERDMDGARLEEAVRALPEQDSAEIRKAMDDAHRETREQLYRLLVEEGAKERQQFFSGERERLAAEVGAELDEEPGYQAQRFFREGKVPEGQQLPPELVTETGAPRLLDRQELIDRYGADFVRENLRGLATNDRERSIPMDMAAEHFKFATGDEMIRELAKLPSRGEVIRRRVQEKLEEQYGPELLQNPEKLSEAALAAAHNEGQVRAIVAGMRVLARRLAPDLEPRFRAIDPAALEQKARDLVETKPLAEVSVARALQAERKAAHDAIELLGKAVRAKEEGVRRQLAAHAFDAHEVQLFNHFLWKAAKEAVEKGERDVSFLRRFLGDAARAKLGKAGFDYLDRVDDLLGSIELRASRSMAEVERRRAINAASGGTDPTRDVMPNPQAAAAMVAWLENQKALNRDPFVPDRVIQNLQRSRHWRELSSEELGELRDTVESIDHLARLKDTLLTNKGRRERRAVIDELSQRLFATYGDNEILVDRNTLGAKKRLLQSLKKMGDGIIRPEELLRQMDGGDPNGPFTRYLWDPVSDSVNRWSALAEKVAKPVLEELSKMPLADKLRWKNQRFTVKGQPFTMEAALAVALNWGNDSNRMKVTKGWQYGGLEKFGLKAWDGPETAHEFLRQLTRADWELVDRVWKQLDSLWPEMAQLEKKMTGLVPPRVKPSAFQLHTADGHDLTLDGGYYPMVYDRRFSHAGAAQDEKADLSSFQLYSPGAERAITPHGHLNARIEDFARPVELSLIGLYRHLQHATKDVAMREALISAHSLVTDGTFRAAIQRTAGEAALPVLDKWIRDTANDLVIPDGGTSGWLKVQDWSRRGITGAAFALHAGHAFHNALGVFNALTKVDGRFMAKGLEQLIANPSESIRFVRGESEEMASRAHTIDRDLKEGMQRALGRTGKLESVKHVGMWAFHASDTFASTATWLGAFHQALAGKAEGVEGADVGHLDMLEQLRAGKRAADAGGVALDPLQEASLAKLEEDQARAVRHANSVVRQTLMAGRTVDLPSISRDPRMKWLTMFSGWASVQLNQLLGTASDVSRDVGDRQYLRALRRLTRGAFWVISGEILYELAMGRGAEDDEEEKPRGAAWSRWMAKRAVLTPFSFLPIVGPITKAVEQGRKDVSLNPMERVYSQLARTGYQGVKTWKAYSEGDDWQEELKSWGSLMTESAAIASGLPAVQVKQSLGYWLDENRDPGDTLGEKAMGTLYGKRRRGSLAAALYGEGT